MKIREFNCWGLVWMFAWVILIADSRLVVRQLIIAQGHAWMHAYMTQELQNAYEAVLKVVSSWPDQSHVDSGQIYRFTVNGLQGTGTTENNIKATVLLNRFLCMSLKGQSPSMHKVQANDFPCFGLMSSNCFLAFHKVHARGQG